MQQPCKKCGYVSPEADKFCRSCGDQLLTESEFSAAVTLNHGRVDLNPPTAVAGTGRFPPSIGDAIAGNTERYSSAPQYAPIPVQFVQPPNYAPPKSFLSSMGRSFSRFWKGAFFFLVFAGLLAATAGIVFFAKEAERANDRYYELEQRVRNRASWDNANGRAQDAWEQMEEALKLTHELEEKAAGAGATLLTGGEKSIDLGKYAYPGAQVEAMVGSHGKEALSLISHEKFETVRAFYERQFGKSVLQVALNKMEPARRRVLFQTSTTPPLLIRIEEIDPIPQGPDQEPNENQVKITILRSLLRFPQD